MPNPNTHFSLKSESWSTQKSFTFPQWSATNSLYGNIDNSSLSKIFRQRKEIKNTGFHNLENNILLLVFSHFSLKELLLVFSRVCRHWNKVTRDPRLWRSLEFKGKAVDTRTICNILRRSPLLEILTLYKIADPVTIIRQLCRCNQALLHLKIRHCQDGVNKNLPESVIRNILHSCSNLQSLDLKDTQFISPRFYQELVKLRQLKKLNLSNNKYVQVDDLITIALNCRYLEDISITRPKTNDNSLKIGNADAVFFFNSLSKTLKRIKFDVVGLGTPTFGAILNCPHLEKLELREALPLTGYTLREYASKLANLKELHLIQASSLISEDFIFLGGKNAFKNLSSLNLTGCYKICNKALESILKCSTKLSCLILKCCKSLNDTKIITKNCFELKYLNIAYAFRLEDNCSSENLIELIKLRTFVVGTSVDNNTLISIHEKMPEVILIRSFSEYDKDEQPIEFKKLKSMNYSSETICI